MYKERCLMAICDVKDNKESIESHEVNCACGQPLHYRDGLLRRFVQSLIDRLGSEVEMCVGTKRYLVQRHYLALHGIKAQELEHLAECGVVKRMAVR